MTAPQPPAEAVQVLREALERQPWYKTFSNTVTTVIGGVSFVAWLLIAGGVDIPADVTKWVSLGIFGATILGVANTPDHLTPRTVKEVEELYIGRHRRD